MKKKDKKVTLTAEQKKKAQQICKDICTRPNSSPSVTDPLKIYMRELGSFPPLSAEEEFELARKFRENDDRDAALKLVTSNLRLVVRIAMEFQRKWMKNVLDLIQEGNVGLMKALKKFDPDKGIKFSYYASFWIRAYILKFIMDNWRMVKVGTTQAQRKLFYNLGKEKQRLESLGISPDSDTISQNLDVSESDVVEMGQRLGQYDLSLDMPLGDDSELTPMNFIPAIGDGAEDILLQEETAEILNTNIQELLPNLNEKEKDIIELRLLAETPMTLREIGEKYNITRERVRQIEARLLEKIKNHIKGNISDFSKEWLQDD
ncbi:sigma-70 family RNA polymerase sigma factor [Desulfonatronovibrio magnus]|uniref:sigma-70 family RNA polymerase sigma factor n=1 Tax=Desulfonatronovibrio magnus TaxID=698827 RepID=UPI0005EB2406|nr:RNA polymerase factor sigma-32 [Desulfonatronovibrio magnus]RQD66481.1 MAG: sigma-70 family RNA polymerase sigma factor [Desulfonatronovibrio sp. MSAO_Bac4]